MRMDLRRHFFTERVPNHWDRLPKEEVACPSLEVLLHTELWCWGAGLGPSLGAVSQRLRGLITKVPSKQNASVAL